jgi:hypothetical protein
VTISRATGPLAPAFGSIVPAAGLAYPTAPTNLGPDALGAAARSLVVATGVVGAARRLRRERVIPRRRRSRNCR